jgi:molecular chaperone IbpA
MTRTFDLTPFTRATVGFDRLFDELDRQFANSTSGGYPPYNIVAEDENSYTISLAVAGFGMDNLDITKEGNVLTVEGTAPEVDTEVRYLHKGIAGRNFRRQFTLADHVEVESATLELGMLDIHLTRRVPEELQPKRIAINTPNVIDSK